MKRSASGEKLYRDMEVRVILAEQDDIVWRRVCEPGHGWDAAALDRMLERAAAACEKQFPSIEFRLVELAPNRIKFIYAGRKDTMNELQQIPEAARSLVIAEKVCAVQGHKLGVFQAGMRPTPNGPEMNTLNFCTACGLGLNEVRGQLDQQFATAVGNEVNRRLAMAAQSNKPAPLGEPGAKITELPKPLAAAAAIPEA